MKVVDVRTFGVVQAGLDALDELNRRSPDVGGRVIEAVPPDSGERSFHRPRSARQGNIDKGGDFIGEVVTVQRASEG